MRWEHAMLRYVSWKMKVRIVDEQDEHQMPTRYYTLASVKGRDGNELLFYFNELQFLAVPLFEEGETRLETTPLGGHFTSHDRKNGLVYTIEFYA